MLWGCIANFAQMYEIKKKDYVAIFKDDIKKDNDPKHTSKSEQNV